MTLQCLDDVCYTWGNHAQAHLQPEQCECKLAEGWGEGTRFGKVRRNLAKCEWTLGLLGALCTHLTPLISLPHRDALNVGIQFYYVVYWLIFDKTKTLLHLPLIYLHFSPNITYFFTDLLGTHVHLLHRWSSCSVIPVLSLPSFLMLKGLFRGEFFLFHTEGLSKELAIQYHSIAHCTKTNPFDVNCNLRFRAKRIQFNRLN